MRNLALLFLLFSIIACKKEEDTFRVPLQVEEESFIVAIDASTGLYKTDINIEVLDSESEAILRTESFSDSLILLSRNEANHLEFSAYEFAFNAALNTIALYEATKPLVFESIDNQSDIERYLYLDTKTQNLLVTSIENTANGEIVKKTYTAYLY